MEVHGNIDHRSIAIFFALTAKEAHENFNEAGKNAILSAVCKFGQKRGKRISEKAREDGYPLDFKSFLTYRDMKIVSRKIKMTKRTPHIEVMISQCGWCDVWKQENLMEFGKLYCQEIDSAIMKGFNPQSRFITKGFLSDGKSNCCHFIYLDEVFRLADIVKFIFIKRKVYKKHGGSLAPYQYHLKELLSILQEEFKQKFGKAGVEAIQRVQKKCFEQYGYVCE
jgi:hypothetical protein